MRRGWLSSKALWTGIFGARFFNSSNVLYFWKHPDNWWKYSYRLKGETWMNKKGLGDLKGDVNRFFLIFGTFLFLWRWHHCFRLKGETWLNKKGMNGLKGAVNRYFLHIWNLLRNLIFKRLCQVCDEIILLGWRGRLGRTRRGWTWIWKGWLISKELLQGILIIFGTNYQINLFLIEKILSVWEGVQKMFFLGLSPKLWVGGGQES